MDKLRILSTNFSPGKKHDFSLYKESKVKVRESAIMKGDLGYLGIDKIHANSQIPKKNTKKHPLSKADKAYNKQLSSERIFIEHVIGKLKIFKIISDRYRNRRKRFGLRFNLIAGIYNWERDF